MLDQLKGWQIWLPRSNPQNQPNADAQERRVEPAEIMFLCVLSQPSEIHSQSQGMVCMSSLILKMAPKIYSPQFCLGT